mmetsp:Transcript_85608/g.184821  ORF Transcript_85608/g.184821 Transcript_85608/m.184821 type:complete len:258 (+) Transcript_85608:18-791(+)
MPRKVAKKSVAKKGKKQDQGTSLFEKNPKKFGIGQDVRPSRDVTRYVRWPKYVRLQRQRRVLYQRLKVPPSVNQFTRALDKNTATQTFKLLEKYKPEDKAAKKQRLLAIAEKKAKGEKVEESKAPNVVKFGLKHVTALVEQKKASLVLIAHDVDPLELVVWLPALCRKKQVPYAIVKGKARLGQVVGKKTAAVVAFTTVNKADQAEFGKLVETIKGNYLDRYDELRKKWGGGTVGVKSAAKLLKREKAIAAEDISKV